MISDAISRKPTAKSFQVPAATQFVILNEQTLLAKSFIGGLTFVQRKAATSLNITQLNYPRTIDNTQKDTLPNGNLFFMIMKDFPNECSQNLKKIIHTYSLQFSSQPICSLLRYLAKSDTYCLALLLALSEGCRFLTVFCPSP